MAETIGSGWHAVGPAGGLDLDATLSSGQCFRWEKADGVWQGVAGRQFARVRVQDGALWADCPASEDGFWRRYFALDMDYGAIQAQFAGSKRLAECVAAAPGLRVLTEEQLERPVEGEIRVVRGDPILYTPAAVLDEAEAAAFLQQDASYTAFVERFGLPCGGWVYAYYELPPENGEPRYLCMSWDEGNDEIYSASVCDEVKSLRLVWKQEENGTIK